MAPQHIWLGVSVEDSKRRSRIVHLRQALASVRFLSIEPLIGDPGALDLHGISWVIAGGESGPKCRPIQKEWVVSVRDQCVHQNVPFFFKQWGGRPKSGGRLLRGQNGTSFRGCLECRAQKLIRGSHGVKHDRRRAVELRRKTRAKR